METGEETCKEHRMPACICSEWRRKKSRLDLAIDYSDVELPANTPGVLTHPSHIGHEGS